MDDHERQKVESAAATLKRLLEDDRAGMFRRVLAVNECLGSGYNWSELDFLRIEVCKCIVFDLPQAAITLTNHLLETAIKNSLVAAEMKKDSPSATKPAEALYEVYGEATEANMPLELGDAINKARRLGLISKKQQKQLHRIRDGLRNPYSHANKAKLLRGVSVPLRKVSLVEGENPTLEEGEAFDVDAAKVPFLHGLLQKKHAEANAIPYFLAIDRVIRDLITRLFGHTDADDA